MKITAIQSDIVWASPAENIKNLEKLMAPLSEANLIVLPEMFSTGFATEPEGIAEGSECISLNWMKAKAREMNCAVAGSIATEQDGKYYNRFYFVKPDGEVTFYDKHHLFTYSGEDKRFTAGSRRVVVEFRGVRFLLQVCYDLRFPVWSRNRGDYDAILYVASWPETRIEAWKTLLRARAIENQCWVVGVNRVGDDPACHYCGGTAVIDPYGKPVAECGYGVQEAISADIDMEALNAFRRKFPVLNDADGFMISQ